MLNEVNWRSKQNNAQKKYSYKYSFFWYMQNIAMHLWWYGKCKEKDLHMLGRLCLHYEFGVQFGK